MYATPQNGVAVVAAATPKAARAAGLQTLVLELVLGSAFATQAEKDRCLASVTRCQDAATLAKWYRNALTELADREEAATPVVYATGEQKQHITRLLNHPLIARRVKTRVLLRINRYTRPEAQQLIADLTALTTAPTGGGACGAESSALVGFSLVA